MLQRTFINLAIREHCDKTNTFYAALENESTTPFRPIKIITMMKVEKQSDGRMPKAKESKDPYGNLQE